MNNQQFSESKGTISIALVHEALSRAQDKGYDIQQILHDAEILTFLIQPPSSIIEYVRGKTGHDVESSRLFLERIVVSQVMYTSLGRSMLRDLSASILIDLRS